MAAWLRVCARAHNHAAVQGEVVPTDSQRGMSYLRIACDGGHGNACEALAWSMLMVDPPHRDTEQGLSRMRALCKSEGDMHRESCFRLGSLLLDAKRQGQRERKTSLPRDPAAASEFLDLACRKEHIAACYNLAVMYKRGDTGVVPDEAKHDHYKQRFDALRQRGSSS